MEIINNSKYTFTFTSSYFESGSLFDTSRPKDIQAGGKDTIYVANKEGSLATGVAGGLDFKIQGSTGDLNLYIGFSNPQFGSYKTFIAVNKGKSAEWAYDQIDDETFKRLSQSGFDLTAAIRPGKRGIYRTFEFTIADEWRRQDG